MNGVKWYLKLFLQIPTIDDLILRDFDGSLTTKVNNKSFQFCY